MNNDTLAAVQAVSAVVVTLTNVVLTFLTYRYVRLTGGMLEHMRQAQTAAVAVDLTFDGHSAYLDIENTGSEVARNLKFERFTGLEWADYDAMKEVRERGISYLPAGRTLRFALGYPSWNRVKEQPIVVIELTFDSGPGTVRREFIIDMMQYAGAIGASSAQGRIADAINGLAEELSRQEMLRSADHSLREMMKSATKICIQCAEAIPAAAKICSHCRAGQDQADTASADPQNERAT